MAQNKIQNFNILYVEDDDLIREHTFRILIKLIEQENIFTASNGLIGLEIFKQSKIDLIISDIMMPIMDGLCMIEEIKALNIKVPIILTTAFDSSDYFLKAIELDVDKYIIKPINWLKLKETIEIIHKNFLFEKELNEQTQILKEYKHAIDESSIVSKADLNGKITYVNDLFCTVSGYERAELIGKSHSIVRHPETKCETFKNLWETILSKKIWRGRIKNRKKDGGFYIVETVITPILDKNGEIKEFISIRQDVTDFVKVGRELLEQKEKEKETEKKHLEELHKTKDSFLVVFTHELKTPLNAIINFASFAIRRLQKPEIKDISKVVEMIETVRENGHDMLEVVNSILDISRLKANKMSFVINDFDISECVDEIIHRYASLIEKESIKVNYNFNHKNRKIFSDKNRLKQLLSNLISNAIKYGNNLIEISTNIDIIKNKLILKVEDNGNGIKNKEAIFGLFEQDENDDMTRTAKGTGVGLHFVKLLSEGLNIGLKLEDSQTLGGASFILEFDLNSGK